MMAIAFRFRFQRVLDVREAVERQRMLALSAELARHEEALASLEAWRTRLRQSEEALRSLYLGRPLVAQAVATELLHREGLRARVAEAERTVEESKRRIEEARRTLLAATKERRIMERLRERHEADWRLAQDRKEQNELDEIGLRQAESRSAGRGPGPTREETLGA